MISCVKLLLIPSYRSTDFEVHRNWLAITYNLPLKEWYYESGSEWTLDYPPLFAWFEYILAQFARFFDPKMVELKNYNYASPETIVFQRLSVIVADLVLALGTKECCQYLSTSGVRKSSKWGSRWGSPAAVLQLLLLGNAGLLIVDHIHFQYNGFLFGILLLSVAKILQGQCLAAAFWFAVLLNLKHIFAYIAPAYVIYLLRNYCFLKNGVYGSKAWWYHAFNRATKLGIVVLAVFLASFGPFIFFGQMYQVLSRLFPFKRGLCHAYWAPNIWALYNFADKAATIVGRRIGFNITATTATMTGGLVQEFDYSVLPNITPRLTFILTLVFIMPCLVKLWRCPGNPLHFVRCLVLCASTAFMFGWHVHEKAILMVIIPLTLMAVVWRKEAQVYILLCIVGHYSLFPLLFTPFELPIKVLLLLIHSLYAVQNLSNLFDIKHNMTFTLPLLSKLESVYVLCLVLLFTYENVIHPLLGWKDKYPFLPLMLTSVYCAMGVLYCWVKYYWHFITMNETNHKRKAY